MKGQYSGKDYGPPAPKPYGFVGIEPRVQREKTVGHEAFMEGYFTGHLRYRLEAQTHLFVGSGTYSLSEEIGRPPGEVIRSFYRVGVQDKKSGEVRMRPAIPGSSLKGAVRAVVEAVTASCIGVTRVDRWRIPIREEKGERCTPDRACPACSMFGTLGRLGKVRFGDALLTSGRMELYTLPNFYRPRVERDRVPKVYLEGDKFKGRKFYLHGRMVEAMEGAKAEVVRQGSVLTGRVEFDNLSREELAALFFALGLDGSFALKLGGGKPACLGTVKSEAVELVLLGQEGLTSYEQVAERYEAVMAGEYIRNLVTEVERQRNFILSRQAGWIRQVLNPKNDRECPTGMY
ncbi:MAG: hypothetical protein ISS50_02325 [Anaerolineae bacterium]|nr:hypothetical protein [Anaerolineae bacterium]